MRPDVIEGKIDTIGEHASITYDPDSKTGYWRGRVATVFYEWSVVETESARFVQQTRRVSFRPIGVRLFVVGLVLAIWSGIYWFQSSTARLPDADITLSLSVVIPLLIVVAILVIACFYAALITIDYSVAPDPLLDTLSNRGERLQYTRYSVPKFLQFVSRANYVFIAGAVMANTLFLTVFFAAAYAILNIIIFAFWLADGGEWLLTSIRESALGNIHISSVAKQYLAYVCLFSSFVLGIQLLTKISWIVLDGISVSGVNSAASQIRQAAPLQAGLADQLLFVLLAAIGVVVFYYDLTRTTKHEYHEFKAKSARRSGFVDDRYQTRSRLKTEQILSGVAVLASSLILYTTFVVMLEMAINIPFVSLPETLISLPLTMFVGSLFPLYFVVGIVWQFRRTGRKAKQLLERSTQQTISYEGTEIPVRAFDHDDYYATSFSLNGNDYIVLSTGLLSAIDESTAAAFAAHEVGHIHHGDTQLNRWLTLLSLLLLVGKNVLYDIIDFHHREHRSDRYAAELLGDKQPVMEALTFLSNHETRAGLPQDFGANAAPTFSPSAIETTLGRPFELFFGGFAVSDAHPSYTDRKQYLRAVDL